MHRNTIQILKETCNEECLPWNYSGSILVYYILYLLKVKFEMTQVINNAFFKGNKMGLGVMPFIFKL
jgi:hypothetical protein